MKKFTIYLVLFIVTSACYGQTTENQSEKINILKNHSLNLKKFLNVANIIDSDMESYWAYGMADSLLGTINFNGNYYETNLSKIYSAYTYIFYGMCYSRTISAISRGGNYTLEGLYGTIIPFKNNIELSKYELSRKEIASIGITTNFYKVSGMSNYYDMYNVYKSFYLKLEEIYKQYPTNEAYRIVSLRNKKLYFQTFVRFILDSYARNNIGTEKAIKVAYINQLVQKGETLDKIPDDYEEIIELTEKEYFICLETCSKVQGEMLQLLTEEIRNIANKNE